MTITIHEVTALPGGYNQYIPDEAPAARKSTFFDSDFRYMKR